MKFKILKNAGKNIAASSSWLAFQSKKRLTSDLFLFFLLHILLFKLAFKNFTLQKITVDNFIQILPILSCTMAAASICFYIFRQVRKREKIDEAQPQVRAATVIVVSLINGIISSLKIQKSDSTQVTVLEVEKLCAEIDSQSIFFDPNFPTNSYDTWDKYFKAQLTELRTRVEELLQLRDVMDGTMLKILNQLNKVFIKRDDILQKNSVSPSKTLISYGDCIISLYKLNKELKNILLKQDRRLLNNIMKEFRQ